MMADQPPTTAQLRASLHSVAERLRDADHLSPESQQAVAELLDEIGRLLDPAGVPSPETANLAASAADMVHALQEKKENHTLLQAAKDRLEDAAFRAETEAPLVTGIVERLIEALANIGI
jgi:hypothetical protein